jgi:mannitol-1-/sugar-/sorbitol-6-phosphatase
LSWAGQAILFDLDGVLVDSISAVERTWLRWAERHGVDEQRVLDTVHEGPARDSVATLAPGLDAQAEADGIDSEQAEDTEGVVALPGAAELAGTLPRERWAVVTSANEGLAVSRLGAAGIPRPRVLITIDAIAHGKPAPDGYLAAALALGFEPRDCLVVENAPSGVASGRAAGATVLALLTSHSREELVQADMVADDLAATRLVAADPPRLELRAPGPAPWPSA